MFVFCIGLAGTPSRAFSQQTTTPLGPNAFAEYFDRVAKTQDVGSTSNVLAYERLVESIDGMTAAEISEIIQIIDRQIDETVDPEKHWSKGEAIVLLRVIAGRPDGPALLESQMDRLTSMLNDPAHTYTSAAVSALQGISFREPGLVWPIFEAALDDPNVNNASGIGPVIAVMLLRMVPHGDDVTQHVVKYMRRSDLTETQLLSLIMGINGGTAIPDILATELVRCLDVPNEHIKSRALVGLARSSPAAKRAAQARIQKMANDPKKTAHVRKIAADALKGEITYDPNP
jgi:hypothetical protein